MMKKTLLFMMLAVLGFSYAVAQESGPLPIVREGVKWVNEKVIVNHGDTTRYYYNYEICGDDSIMPYKEDWGPYKACYYYTGENLDVSTDSLIASLRGGKYFAHSSRNNAYWKVKLLFQVDYMMFSEPMGGELMLYEFYNTTVENTTDCILVHYYLFCQDCDGNHGVSPRDPYLTYDNFYEVDPVEVEGVSCRRWVIMGDEGEPLAYIVEGIGFDSYDMGDLLTPFTCRPDPEADYQEWCGLSHVVKDGQIIYKGMRYRDDAMTAIDEVVIDKTRYPLDQCYYDLMGRAVGSEVPTTPGIYIHQGKKICVSRMP